MNDTKRYIAGGISGIIEVLLTHPIDYIKTQKQIYTQNKVSVGFIKYISRNSFYSGIVPRIAGVAPMRFVFCVFQGNSYNYTANTLNYSPFYSGLIAGTLGGAIQTLIDNPIEISKIKLMNNQTISMKDLFNQYGFVPTLLRNIGFAICISSLCFNKKDCPNSEKFLYSAGEGLLGSFLAHPLDYIKTYQQQNNCNNAYDIVVRTFKENPFDFYSGLMGRMVLSSLTMGIGFVSYENILIYI